MHNHDCVRRQITCDINTATNDVVTFEETLLVLGARREGLDTLDRMYSSSELMNTHVNYEFAGYG